jgi:hypothetical protein
LNSLLNEVSFKNFAHSEIEIKLFLAYLQIIKGNETQAESLIRSVSRKIKETFSEGEYANALAFIKFLKQVNSPKKTDEESFTRILKSFSLFNNIQHFSLLGFLRLDKVIQNVLKAKT